MSKHRWEQIAASGGLIFIFLVFAGQGLIQVGGREPAFSAQADEILSFFETRDPLLFTIGGFLVSVSYIAMIWFLGAVWARFRRYEESPRWMSFVAVGSALVGLAVNSATTGWPMAVFRVEEGLEPQLARYLFDDGNFGFATLWVYLAGFLLAAGVIALRDGALPRWLGWYALLTSVALLIGRAFWDGSSGLAFIPYMLSSLWIVATSIYLMRAVGKDEHAKQPAQAYASR